MREFHSYEQIECTASDDEDLGIGTSGVDNGIYIDLPTSVSKFKWFDLITVDQTAYDPETAKSVSKDVISGTGPITKRQVLARMTHRIMLDTAVNYDVAKEELELLRMNVHDMINSWLCRFIVMTSQKIGMKLGSDPIVSWNDYLKWLHHYLNNEDDAMNVMKSAYFSFQHNTDYKKHLTFALCIELNLAIIKKKDVKTRGNFIEKIITYRQNEIRKQICRASGKYSGYTFRIIRAHSADKSKTMQRNHPRYFHDWMLQYKPSSYVEKKRGRPIGSTVNEDTNRVRAMGPYKTNSKKKKKAPPMTKKEIAADIALQELELEIKRAQYLKMNDDDDSNGK